MITNIKIIKVHRNLYMITDDLLESNEKRRCRSCKKGFCLRDWISVMVTTKGNRLYHTRCLPKEGK